jgi:hypothetical protein
MRQFNGGQRSHCKNVVDEFLFAQSDAVHNSIEMIAGGSVANSHVPQGIFDIAGQTEKLPGGQFQTLNSGRTVHTPEPPMPRRWVRI